MVDLAPTNAVAQDLGADGFREASTVHAALFRLKNGRDSWARRTVVIVDRLEQRRGVGKGGATRALSPGLAATATAAGGCAAGPGAGGAAVAAAPSCGRGEVQTTEPEPAPLLRCSRAKP